MDFFQNTCFKESNRMAVEKNSRWLLKKTMSTFCQIEKEASIEASCTNNIHTGVKTLCSCYFIRFVSLFISGRAKKLLVYFPRRHRT